LPAYEAASTLSPMSQEIISKVREVKKKVKKQQQVSIGMHLATTPALPDKVHNSQIQAGV